MREARKRGEKLDIHDVLATAAPKKYRRSSSKKKPVPPNEVDSEIESLKANSLNSKGLH